MIKGKRQVYDAANVEAVIERRRLERDSKRAPGSTSTIVPTVAMHCRFNLPTASLSIAEMGRIETDLTFVVKQTASFGKGAPPPKTYKAFAKGGGVISLPAYYGYTVFGPAFKDETVEGLDNPSFDVVAVLRDTDDYPQIRARKAVWDFWEAQGASGAAVCTMVMPCGAGKTITSVATVVPKCKRFVFITHSDDIADQAMATYENVTKGGLRMGRVQGKRLDVGDEYHGVVMMIPTLIRMIKDKGLAETRRLIRADTYGIVVGDECHHLAASMFMQTVFLFSARYWVFLTATPERDDGLSKELEYLTGPIVYRGRDVTGNAAVLNVQWRVPPQMPAIRQARTGKVDYTNTVTAMCKADDYNSWGCDVAMHGLRAGHDVILFTLRTNDIMPGLAAAIHARIKAWEAKTGTPLRRNLVHIEGHNALAPLVSVVMSTVSKDTKAAMAALGEHTAVVGYTQARDAGEGAVRRSPLYDTCVAGGLTPDDAMRLCTTKDKSERRSLYMAKAATAVAASILADPEPGKVAAAAERDVVAEADALPDPAFTMEEVMADLMSPLLPPGDVELVDSSKKYPNPATKAAKRARVLKQNAKHARVLICTVDKLKEGYNAPWKSMAIFLHSRKGENTNTQVIGRITREWDACKLQPFVVDMAMGLSDAQIFMTAQRERKKLYRRRKFPMTDHTMVESSSLSVAAWNRVSEHLGLHRQVLAAPASTAAADASSSSSDVDDGDSVVSDDSDVSDGSLVEYEGEEVTLVEFD